jgi:adenosylhomocysteine nucleosidase
MAGGLEPALAPGTIFLPSEVISPDGGQAVATERSWYERLGAAISQHRPVLHGRLITSPKSVGTLADKAALFRATGAAAVDMESLAIAMVARDSRVPFIAVRVIVDSAADALPQAVTAAADSEGHLQIWRLLGALARTPGELGPLIRLAGRYRAANRSLAAVARVGALAVA